MMISYFTLEEDPIFSSKYALTTLLLHLGTPI